MANERIAQTLDVKVIRGNGQDRQTLRQIIPRKINMSQINEIIG